MAYINNTEAARSSNMPAGAIGYDSLASPDHEGGSFESFSVDTTVLTAGQNILAIEVHQQSISSSDLSFDAELTYSTGPFSVHLTWDRNGTDTTVAVTWLTVKNAGNTVEYGLTDSYGSQQGGSSFYSSNCGYYVHEVTLTGLSPDTAYHYRCGAAGKWSRDYTFVTAPSKGDTSPLYFAAMADARNLESIRDAIIELGRSKNPMFVTWVGDFVNSGSVQSEWDSWFSSAQDLIANAPLIPVLGNHEEEAPQYFDQFDLPSNEKYYSLNYGNVHFIVLNSAFDDSRILPGSAQYNWLQSDLQQTDADTDITWKIVLFHTPVYSSASGHPSNTGLRSDIEPLFNQYGVDVVFNGHNHSYERTYMIRENGQILQTGPTFYVTEGDSTGTVYVVVAGMSPLYEPGWNSWTAYFEKTYNYGMVTVEGDTLSFKAMRQDDTLIDTFAIIKREPQGPAKLKITTPPVVVPKDNPSSAIVAQVQDTAGCRVYYYSGTVTLSASSATGRFSVNNISWQDTTLISVSSGMGTFYYKDSNIGSFKITVSRQGLIPDSQAITVNTGTVCGTTSYLRTSTAELTANGTSACTVTVTIMDKYGARLEGSQVTIYSSRGAGVDTITQTSTVTDIAGMCTGTIRSSASGNVTVYALCDGETIYENFVINPSFENGSTGWTMNSATVGSDFAYSGNSSQRLIAPGSNITGAYIADYIPITNNSSSMYEVFSYVKAQVTNPSYFFSTYFYDSGDAYISHSDITGAGSTIDWTQYTKTYGGTGSGADVTFPANCTQMGVRFSWWAGDNNCLGTGWSDAVRIKRIPTLRFTSISNISPVTSFLTTDAFSMLADGISKCTVTIMVKSDTGVAIQGRQVTIFTDRGSSDTITQPPAVTDANGQCTGTIKSLIAGNATVYVICEGETILGNWVLNGSFEDGATGWNMQSATIDTTVYSGNKSTRLVATGANCAGAISTDFIPIVNNSKVKYEASAYCKATVTTAFFLHGVYYYNASGADVGHNDFASINSTIDWTKYSKTYGGAGSGADFTFPSNCVKVKVRAGGWWNGGGNPSGTGWTDAVRFKRIPTITFVGSANGAASYLTTSTSFPTANGISKCTVTVTVRDSTGSALQGESVTIYTSRGTGIDTITQPSAMTDANGQCTGTIKSSVSGSCTIWAVCEYEDIYENLVVNPSFENGSTGWTMNSAAVSGDFAYSGNYSQRLIAPESNINGAYSGYIPIINSSSFMYEVSSYVKAQVTNPRYCFSTSFYDSGGANIGGQDLRQVDSTIDWTKYSKTCGGSGSGADVTFPANCTQIKVSFVWWIGLDNCLGTAWSDAVRIKRIPTVTFVGNPSKLKITSDTFAVNLGSAPPPVTIQAQDTQGFLCSTYNETVTLSASSASGSFSLNLNPWSETTIITLSGGEALFYYNDSSAGTPTITVSRAGLAPDSQREKFCLPAVKLKFISSAFSGYAGGVCPDTVIVEARGADEARDVLFNNTAVLSSSSPQAKFSRHKYAWNEITIVTFKDGLANFYYKDFTSGNPVITVSRAGLTRDTQTQTINAYPRFYLSGCYERIQDTDRSNDEFTVGMLGLSASICIDNTGGVVRDITVTVKNLDPDYVTLTNTNPSYDVTKETNSLTFHFYAGAGSIETSTISPWYVNSNNFYFLFFSDNHSIAEDNPVQFPIIYELINQANTINAPFIFNGGDLINEAADISGIPIVREEMYEGFRDAVKNLRMTFIPAMGNHDAARGPGSNAYYYSEDLRVRWFGNLWHAFNYGNSRFYVLDTYKDYPDWLTVNGGPWFDGYIFNTAGHDEEFKWLQNDLQASQGSAHRITLFHQPFPGWKSASMTEVLQLFHDNNVSYMLNGHVHIYQYSIYDGIPQLICAGLQAGGDFYYSLVNVRGEGDTPTHKMIRTDLFDVTVDYLNSNDGTCTQSFATITSQGNYSLPYIRLKFKMSNDTDVYKAYNVGTGATETIYVRRFKDYTVCYVETSINTGEVKTIRVGETPALPNAASKYTSYLILNSLSTAASGVDSITVNALLYDSYGYAITFGTAILAAARGNSTAISANPQTPDSSRVCTWTISSQYSGWETLTASCGGYTINKGVYPGLVMYQAFEEGSDTLSKDLSFYDNDGNIHGASWTTLDDTFGKALDFEYTTADYVEIPYDSSIACTQQITVLFWMKIGTVRDWARIISKSAYPNYDYIFIKGNNNRASLLIKIGGVEINAYTSAGSVLAGAWYHMAGTYDGSRVRTYINGIEKGTSGVTSGSIDNNSGPLYIGKDVDGSGAFDGIIDDVKIYNRALSDTEIKATYQAKARVYFGASHIRITTPQRSVVVGEISDSIVVEVQDGSGTKDASFNNTVTLSTSSDSGSFSLSDISWSNTTIITLSSGSIVFYYKDLQAGYPVITVSRYGLTSGTQIETITGTGTAALDFVSSPFSIAAGDTSPQIKVAAKTAGGDTDTSFSNTVALSTSSNSGVFSILSSVWKDTSIITFSSGIATFYYKDAQAGYPILTAFRSGLLPDTQVHAIRPQTLVFTSPVFTMTSISTAALTAVYRNADNNTATGWSDTATVITSSAKGKFSVSQAPWKDTTTIQFTSGIAIFYYADRKGGNPIITVTRPEYSLSDTQSDTVTKPMVTASKAQYNLRSLETGTMPIAMWSGDTIEYIIYIENTGTETSTGNIISDTYAFDTGTNNPLEYIYMDTFTIANTWAYTIDPTFSVWITGSPATGASNVKGLMWRISSLGINETKAIRFRVRVK
ncbi:hypothetical protein COY52_13015 [Candidatus Desantisbacteria bacterium CG_4_10_14_0_8_um_filter_48_22]|uniref:Fibronectin type-III domain-containing protein n=1 Tax=Candidatus Desantisbacteria bacterium CG_4_10_14_0_8_um_filter_48_22 TaxID=1974543 RepID=A0A2M7S3Z5_9BACT|nr:MAG: hypothetical protein COS16_09190 [Candidatus Desantisbacteria bacterium CG02_land_8_20_14_3_00_49_13]PIZ14264.1 MAG: hypothetical protein COY52_13015 [Candidatus Desantisbacteria bacterium CG_4_10_14_0_8_um_filter_48_22]